MEIKTFALENNAGTKVVLSSLGAGIVSLCTPDRDGRMDDIVLGYKDMESYLNDGPCMGKIPGRFANRIALGRFSLDGKNYTLNINNGPNHLHGGPTGFANLLWSGKQHDNRVTFTLVSPDGHEGYPGTMTAKAVYTLGDDNSLTLDLYAATDQATVVNLTSHVYFNLNGHTSGSVLDHKLKLNCSTYLPTDETLIPTGEMAAVKNTPMDFTIAKALGKDIKEDFTALKYGKGYDNCFVTDGWEKDRMTTAAELYSEKSGRKVTLATTQRGVQIYTGNWLEGSPEGKEGHMYHDYDGVAMECQALPDAPNKPQFPSVVLRPGETYHQTIKMNFSVI